LLALLLLWQCDWDIACAVHTIQTTDASIVCADGHFADTKCSCTTLSFLLDQFLGLLDSLSCCHYGGHLAVLVLVVVWGLLNDDDGAAMGPVLQVDCSFLTRSEVLVSPYAPVLFLQDARVGYPSVFVPTVILTTGALSVVSVYGRVSLSWL
jgi:hypothetical protein